MQLKYLEEIKKRFGLPVLEFPLMEDEIRGMKMLEFAVKYIEDEHRVV